MSAISGRIIWVGHDAAPRACKENFKRLDSGQKTGIESKAALKTARHFDSVKRRTEESKESQKLVAKRQKRDVYCKAAPKATSCKKRESEKQLKQTVKTLKLTENKNSVYNLRLR
jgi:hypothetical protein